MENLYRSLEIVGLEPDEGYAPDGDRGEHGPYIQSKRREKHLAYAYELIEKGKAYYCFCDADELEKQKEKARSEKRIWKSCDKCRDMDTKRADSMAAAGEPHVIRLKTPEEGSIKMNDLIRGEIEIGWDQVDDQVLIKTDGYPTYHLAATTDDHDMEISHVIRGEEWISSFPKHVYLYECFGWETPQFAHLPLLLNPDKSKLSKRQGDVAVEDYLNKGYLPEALINFVALLGWNPSGDQEVYNVDELVKAFDITKVNKGGAVFNVEKLDWMNGEYIKALDQKEYEEKAISFLAGVSADKEISARAALIYQDRVTKLSELPEPVTEFLQPIEDYPVDLIIWRKKRNKLLTSPEKREGRMQAKARLEGVRVFLNEWKAEDFASIEKIENKLLTFVKENGWGNGDTLWPLRVALSGREKSPSPFEYLFVFGKEECLTRIDEAIARLA